MWNDRGDAPRDGRSAATGALPDVLLRALAATVAPEGITIASCSGDLPLVYANEAFLRMTGYQPGDILGRNCRFLQGPDTDAATLAVIHRALAAAEAVRVVLRNYRRDGSPFWNELSISPVRHATTGAVTHFIGTQTEVAPPVD
jgi:PAS domain S-box-containing protein